MTTQSPSPLTIDDLKAMPMAEVFNLVKEIDSACKVHSVNMQLIQKFIKDNFSV